MLKLWIFKILYEIWGYAFIHSKGVFKQENFSEEAKSFFLIFFPGVKCFFPVENFHFGRPKTNFSGFEKWEGKKKKKGSSPHFVTFPPSIFNFPPSLLHISFFSSQFSPLFPFFLLSFIPVDQQKFPNQKSLGPCLLHHWPDQVKSAPSLDAFKAYLKDINITSLIRDSIMINLLLLCVSPQSTPLHG